jgi:pilus assembly protein Flp/PilA
MTGFAGFDLISRGALRLRAASAALRQDRRGVTALEYGLIAALIAVAIIGGVTSLGGQLNTAFNNIATEIGSRVGSGSGSTP